MSFDELNTDSSRPAPPCDSVVAVDLNAFRHVLSFAVEKIWWSLVARRHPFTRSALWHDHHGATTQLRQTVLMNPDLLDAAGSFSRLSHLLDTRFSHEYNYKAIECFAVHWTAHQSGCSHQLINGKLAVSIGKLVNALMRYQEYLYDSQTSAVVISTVSSAVHSSVIEREK